MSTHAQPTPASPTVNVTNLFDFPADLSTQGGDEVFHQLISTSSFKVERILSWGQVTPKDSPYDQDEDEWVTLLQGQASIELYDEGLAMFRLSLRSECVNNLYVSHVLLYLLRLHFMWAARGRCACLLLLQTTLTSLRQHRTSESSTWRFCFHQSPQKTSCNVHVFAATLYMASCSWKKKKKLSTEVTEHFFWGGGNHALINKMQ